MLQYPYYEAHGLAILALREPRARLVRSDTIEDAVIVLSLVAVAIVVALRLLRRGSLAFSVLTGVAAVAVVAWSMTTQVYAAKVSAILSKQVARNLPKPYDWVEQATGGGSVVVLGQQIIDPTNIWLDRVLQPVVRKMWSVDGTAIRVGAPILTPDLDATDGTLTPPPGHRLRAGGERRRASGARRRAALRTPSLYRLDGKPIKLQEALVGRESDGWIVAPGGEKTARAAYTRYDVSGDGPGFAVVKLSRVGWCPKAVDAAARAPQPFGSARSGSGRTSSPRSRV